MAAGLPGAGGGRHAWRRVSEGSAVRAWRCSSAARGAAQAAVSSFRTTGCRSWSTPHGALTHLPARATRARRWLILISWLISWADSHADLNRRRKKSWSISNQSVLLIPRFVVAFRLEGKAETTLSHLCSVWDISRTSLTTSARSWSWLKITATSNWLFRAIRTRSRPIRKSHPFSRPISTVLNVPSGSSMLSSRYRIGLLVTKIPALRVANNRFAQYPCHIGFLPTAGVPV